MQKFVKENSIKLTDEQYEYCMKNFDKDECKELLYKGHLKFAMKMASKFYSERYPQEELQSEALVALWQSILIFDPSKGYKLTTISGKVIYNKLVKYLRKHKDHPADLSLDQPATNGFNDNKETFMIDMVEDKTQSVDAIMASMIVNEYIDMLPEQEKRIFLAYYFDDISQVRIAEEEKCTQVNISRLLQRSRDRMLIKMATGKDTKTKVYKTEVEVAKILLGKSLNKEII